MIMDHKIDYKNYRALTVLSQGNHSIIHILEEEELLQEICRVFVGKDRYKMAWIGLIEEDQTNLRSAARSGLETIDTENVPCTEVQALNTGLVDVSTIDGHSIVTFPLRVEEEHIGILQVYAEEGAFAEEEVRLLQQLVDNISYALAEERFDEAEEEEQFLASQKWDALGKLSAGIAHDFNNVLVPIIGFTEVVLDSLPPESDVKIQLQQALKTAYRAKDITKQILAFSRRETQTRQEHDLSHIIKDQFKLLHDTIPSSVHVTLDLEKNCFPALINPSQMGQVLVNLCMNSQEAMSDHGELIISVQNAELKNFRNSHGDKISGAYVVLKVQDDGYGIAIDDIQHVFEPLFSTQKEEGRAGLGLSAVLRIVEAHHGFIEIESQIGQGTTLTLYMPAMAAAQKPAPVQKKEGDNSEIQVLFVDDEELIRNLAKSLLLRSDFKLTFARHGREALEIFKADPYRFDLVVTDYAMPIMDGLELSEHIRATRSGTPVLLCTGNNDPDLEDVIHLHGITSLLRKPYGVKVFKRALWEALGK